MRLSSQRTSFSMPPVVAGEIPPVVVEHRGGGLGVVEVPRKPDRAADADLTDLTFRQAPFGCRRGLCISMPGHGAPTEPRYFT